ncbi:MAG: glycerol kinase [Pseudomonadales bacterium]|nr:glycerol kinase [Pseudomonadales bacterium]MEC8813056.1 glycerol kinase GlpK [Pseudomonadota bacterium]TNC88515.1 MAG: glycerol kinase [Alcanivorax sp.]HAU13225.1 glycerol kinase [Gammaproteobacteria bacterium]HCB39830.1 glycerol kinase [Gammaproteobacteria bacterium]|tara:strand:- start:3457 stop:4944 length:1488 start_codon:yes stop_codon:yes gene_type:complete
MSQYLLSIDQGTTSSRAIVFDQRGTIVTSAQREFTQFFPDDGWVEHDVEEIWETTLAVCREALKNAQLSATEIAGIGITNQRETTIVWERDTGRPIHKAIVWQDRRTSALCMELKKQGHEQRVQAATGLLIDPYFSATKVAWILDHVEGARQRAEQGELAFGTVDSFLLWRLTKGASHKTDATNASRTMLYNIHSQQWDDEMLALFRVPRAMMPEVEDCAADFGDADPDWLGASIPVAGIAGDQQAALIGQACFKPGMVKSTYGTGCFMILNTGDEPVESRNRLLTTVGYRLNGKVTYALEGSIFIAGAAIQWLRDGIALISHARETEAMAQEVGVEHGVYMVPAFTGLGAPYWDPEARGALFGLTRDTGIKDIVTAGLQSVAYQTKDLIHAMEADGAGKPTALRVDGGMVANNWVVQFLSDILNVNVDRPAVIETTALGAAYLAGLQVGVYPSLEEIASLWHCERHFTPEMKDDLRDDLYQGWVKAVARVRTSD